MDSITLFFDLFLRSVKMSANKQNTNVQYLSMPVKVGIK